MSDWRKVCEGIIKAAGKASKRPWFCGLDRDIHGNDIAYLGVVGSPERERVLHTKARGEKYVPNTDYVRLSANHADRLARFAMRLVELIDEGWVGPKDAERWASEIWEETAKP